MAQARSAAARGARASCSDCIDRIRRLAARPDHLRKAGAALRHLRDRRLQAPKIIVAVKTAFGLDGSDAVVKSDLHYARIGRVLDERRRRQRILVENAEGLPRRHR
jgi:hypothetical protein